jgi:outer membrane protein insertion porin family
VPVETDGAAAKETGSKPPVVDITMQYTEGPQYFVNRITFTGNTTTRDNVIRREMRLVEGNVFDTEALQVQRPAVESTRLLQGVEGQRRRHEGREDPGQENTVDVTLKFEEQNRNQLTFGAGVSQYEGCFGQLAFQTSNFLGRGESLTVSMQAGDRAQNYQLAFSEPFLFDRNITGGFDIYKRSLQYVGTTRRSRMAAISSSASRSPTSAGCSSTTRTRRSRSPTERGADRPVLSSAPGGCSTISSVAICRS